MTVAIGLVIASGALVFGVSMLWSEPPPKQLGMDERLYGEFVSFRAMIGGAWIVNREPPRESLEASLEMIRALPDVGIQLPVECERLVRGRDYWGNPFVYKFHEEEFVVILRSIGPNCRDDHGQVDDTELIIELPKSNRVTTTPEISPDPS